MSEPRKAQTTKIGGGADYAKVAERLRLFREDNPRGKHESAYEVDVDGSLVFTVWLWKDKTDLLDLMKSGITDKDALRSSADANGNSKGQIESKAKDFEKLESQALGRALANLGYLASGEIASFEEMEEFYRLKEAKVEADITIAIERIESTNDNDRLNAVVKSIGDVLKYPAVIEAGKRKRAEFNDAAPQEATSEDTTDKPE